MVAAEREAELGKHDLDRVGVFGLDLDEVEARRLVERQQSGEAAVRASNWAARSSRNDSERKACTAVRVTSVCRKMSLNTSSDSGPAYPVHITWATNCGRSKSPSPGNSR